jgi:hypothetical protein
VILSHRHRFIYVKTFKTASTSVEAALLKLCGPDDIVTPPWSEARNYQLEHPSVPKRPLLKKLLGRPLKRSDPSVGYYHHMPAWRVREYVGEDVWENYFKFTFERNPWDRQVSQFLYWKQKQKRGARDKTDFEAFMDKRHRAYVGNFDLYSANGKVILDFVGKYETLAEDFGAVLVRLGVTEKIGLPRLNASNSDETAYRHFYGRDTKRLVADWYRREIEHFGYEF